MDIIYAVAKNVDANTLSLQYFDTLKTMGTAPSTKFIVPMEFTKLLEPFSNLANKMNDDTGKPKKK